MSSNWFNPCSGEPKPSAGDLFIQDRNRERSERAKKVKGKWAIVELYPGGTHGVSSAMTYAEAKEMEHEHDLSRKNSFSSIMKVVKWRDNLPDDFNHVKTIDDFLAF